MNTTHLTPLGKLVVLVLVMSIGAVAGAAGANAVRPHASEWRCVTVGPGDTLWGLAAETSDGDPRKGVHRIVEHNALVGAEIHPGMGLWVPRADGDPVTEADACSTST